MSHKDQEKCLPPWRSRIWGGLNWEDLRKHPSPGEAVCRVLMPKMYVFPVGFKNDSIWLSVPPRIVSTESASSDPDSCIVTCKGCMHIVAVTGYLMYTVIFVLCGRAKLLYTTVVLLGKIVYFKTEKYLQEWLLQNRNYRLSAWLACVCGHLKLKFICL